MLLAGPSWDVLDCLERDWRSELQEEENNKKKAYMPISNKGWTALIHNSVKNSGKCIGKQLTSNI